MSHFTGIPKITICDVSEVNIENYPPGCCCLFFLCIERFSMETWCGAVQTTEPFCIVCTGHKDGRRWRAMTQKRKLSLAFSNFWAPNLTIILLFTSLQFGCKTENCILSNKTDSEESISCLPCIWSRFFEIIIWKPAQWCDQSFLYWTVCI